MKKGIKVVRRYEGYEDFFCSVTNLGKITRFRIGELTTRDENQGAFAGFKNIHDALNFVKENCLSSTILNQRVRLIEIEYKESEEKKLYYVEHENYAEYGKTFQNYGIFDGFPKGTVFIDEFKPIRVISDREIKEVNDVFCFLNKDLVYFLGVEN
jgi:hypothetical protein